MARGAASTVSPSGFETGRFQTADSSIDRLSDRIPQPLRLAVAARAGPGRPPSAATWSWNAIGLRRYARWLLAANQDPEAILQVMVR